MVSKRSRLHRLEYLFMGTPSREETKQEGSCATVQLGLFDGLDVSLLRPHETQRVRDVEEDPFIRFEREYLARSPGKGET